MSVMPRFSTRALTLALVSISMLAGCLGPEVVGIADHRRQADAPMAPSGAHGGPMAGEPARGSSASGAGAIDLSLTGQRRIEPYRGLGTWIDIYDDDAWDRPVSTVRSMAEHGVRTIYLQTSNFNRGKPFVHLEGVEAILDAAHRHGMRVVAWYLPGFRNLGLDLHRAIRSIRFRTAAGNGFDSFAMDIESPEVRRPRLRTARLLKLSAWLRRAVGADYSLGAIVASPRRLRSDPWFWPGFPWQRLARTYDVFLPMTYYTYRVSGRDGAAWYTAKNVVIIRQETEGMEVPIHVIGGISFDATGAETRGFVDAVRERDVIGASYYTFPGITRDQWKALRALS
jgi:hypothetical protein